MKTFITFINILKQVVSVSRLLVLLTAYCAQPCIAWDLVPSATTNMQYLKLTGAGSLIASTCSQFTQ